MHLIVGLGNPGAAYQGTRHNIGFQVIDSIADDYRLSYADSKWQAKVAKGVLWDHPVILARPETYMNESGRAIGQIASYYRIPPQDIIVLHDDLDLPLARIKVVVDRGAGGHNGIISLIAHLNSREFVRVRLGIGRPDPAVPVKNFVLARFLPDEQSIISQQLDRIKQAVRLILDKGPLPAMALVNGNRGA